MLGIKDGPIEKKAMVIDMKINITREFSYEMSKKNMELLRKLVIQ